MEATEVLTELVLSQDTNAALGEGLELRMNGNVDLLVCITTLLVAEKEVVSGTRSTLQPAVDASNTGRSD